MDMELGKTLQGTETAGMDNNNSGVSPAQHCGISTDQERVFNACKSSTWDCRTLMGPVKFGEMSPSSRDYPDALNPVKVEGVEAKPYSTDNQQHNIVWIKTEVEDEPSSSEYCESFDIVKVTVGEDSFSYKCHDSMDGSKSDMEEEASANCHDDSIHPERDKAAEDPSGNNCWAPDVWKKMDAEETLSAKDCEDSNRFMNNEERHEAAMIGRRDSLNRVNVGECEKTHASELRELARYPRLNGQAPVASAIQESFNVGAAENSAAETDFFTKAKELHIYPRRCETERCEKNFPGNEPRQYSGLEMHLTHSEENDVLCRESLTNAPRFPGDQRPNLYIVQKVPTREKPYECLECNKTYGLLSDMKRHQRIHTGEKPYACTVCNKAFRLSSTWSIHQRSHTGEKPYECVDCKKTFTQLSTLHSHQRIHTGEKPYECRVCSRSFTDSSTLRQHERTHTGEKPYQCAECKQTFTQSSALRRHEAIHTGEKPYECTVCKKSFSDSSTMVAHQRIHTGEKPYQCNWCEKHFRDSSTLRGHWRIHTGEKPYECGECKKTFNQSSSLLQHKRIHTGEKPFACTACSMAFSVSYALRKHQRIHTGEKPFECKQCSKTFRISSDLARHYKIHNRGLPVETTNNVCTPKSEPRTLAEKDALQNADIDVCEHHKDL